VRARRFHHRPPFGDAAPLRPPAAGEVILNTSCTDLDPKSRRGPIAYTYGTGARAPSPQPRPSPPHSHHLPLARLALPPRGEATGETHSRIRFRAAGRRKWMDQSAV
jgi:hypothetical protein